MRCASSIQNRVSSIEYVILHYHYPNINPVVSMTDLCLDEVLQGAIFALFFLLVGIVKLRLPGIWHVTFESPDVLPITFILVTEPPANTFKRALICIE